MTAAFVWIFRNGGAFKERLYSREQTYGLVADDRITSARQALLRPGHLFASQLTDQYCENPAAIPGCYRRFRLSDKSMRQAIEFLRVARPSWCRG